MTSINRGTFSIRGVSISKTSGNILETILTGSGIGMEGSKSFQSAVLNTIEGIIRNRYNSDYSLPLILQLQDQPAVGQSFPLSLLAVPEEITQSQVPSESLLQSFLLKDDSLTEDSTTEIIDSSMVKLIGYIVSQSFSSLQKASKIITEDSSSEFTESPENGRLNILIDNNVFSMNIIIQ